MKKETIKKYELQDFHRFIDESGDMTFQHEKVARGGNTITVGLGASASFMVGMTYVKEDLNEARKKINDFCKDIQDDIKFNNIESVKRLIKKEGKYYPHAKNDPKQLRESFFNFICSNIDFTTQVVVARKSAYLLDLLPKNNLEAEFYANLTSHLIKDKGKYPKLVLNIAGRGNTTSNANLKRSIDIAQERTRNSTNNLPDIDASNIKFNVQPYSNEPLLAITDYALWAVQRVFEKGDLYFYNLLLDNNKIPLVLDLYDTKHYKNSENYRTKRNPLNMDCWLRAKNKG